MPARSASAAIRSGLTRTNASPSATSSVSSARQSTLHGTRDVAHGVNGGGAAVGPPAKVEDTEPGPSELLGQPFGRGQELGSGQAVHGRYHTAVVAPFQPGPEKLEAVRSALPALAAGIYLNTGSVGPLPAETAAAMAEIATWERDVGRAHPDAFDDLLVRMGEARAGVAAVLGTDVGAVALTHSTTDAMNAGTLAASRRPSWRAGGHDPARTPRRPGPALRDARPRRRRGRDRRCRRRRRRRPNARRLRCRDHPGDAPGVRLARDLDDRRGPAGRGHRRARPRPRCAADRGRRPGRGCHPVPLRRARRRLLRRARPEVAARSRRDGRAGRAAVVDRAGDARARRVLQLRASRRGWRRPTGGATPVGSSRRATTGRRWSGWLARSAGCRCTSGSTTSSSAGRPWPGPPPAGSRRSTA